MQNTEDYKKAYFYAIRLLTRQDYSVAKLKKKLAEKKYEKPVIEELINELLAKNYLREENYLIARIKGLMYKHYAARFIQQKLAQESIQCELDYIYEIFAENRLSEQDQILTLIQKKTRSLKEIESIDLNFRKKLLRFLVSKGHSFDNAIKTMNSYLKGEHSNEEDFQF